MGIKGLTGFIAQRQAALSRSIIFEKVDDEQSEVDLRDDNDPEDTREQLIIDGNAFCYRISRIHLDWTKGGEAATLNRVISAYIQGWRNAGLNPVFVWDGVFDTPKLETVKSRLQSSIRNSITYFRSSPTLRTHKGFKSDNHSLSQLAIKSCIAHIHRLGSSPNDQSAGDGGLRSEKVEQHFPGGEADNYIANLAIQRNAYILSLDSDFFITNYGCKGYIPLDSIQFIRKEKKSAVNGNGASLGMENRENDDNGNEGEWGQVTNSRRKPKHDYSSRIDNISDGNPSRDAYTSISLANQVHCKIYTAQALSTYLSLPSPLHLPFCAILLGNDYYAPPIYKSSSNNNSTNTPTSSNRVEIIANTITKHLRKLKKPITDGRSLKEIMKRIIDDLRDFAISDSMIDEITDKSMKTLSEYMTMSLKMPYYNGWNAGRKGGSGRSGFETPLSMVANTSSAGFGIDSEESNNNWTGTNINPLHSLLLPSTSSSTHPSHQSSTSSESSTEVNNQITQIKLRIYNAFETGHFRNSLLQMIVYKTFTPVPILEDPDRVSCVVSIGRGIRGWIYSILQESVGLGRVSSDGAKDGRIIEGTQTDEDDSDASLSNEDVAQTEEEKTNACGNDSQDLQRQTSNPPVIVTEYVRRNATLSEEPVLLPSWSSLDPAPSNSFPPLSRSTIDRYSILLHATSSNTQRLRDAPSSAHLQLISVILALRHIAFTFEATNQAWSRNERRAGLLMTLIVNQSYQGNEQAQSMLDKQSNDYTSPITNEYIQRSAQFTTSLLSISLLIEALLLAPLFTVPPEILYQGSLFFHLLDVMVRDEDVGAEKEMVNMLGLKLDQVMELVDIMEEGLPDDPVNTRKTSSNKSKKQKKQSKQENKSASSGHNGEEGSSANQSAKGPLNKFALLAS